MPECTSISCKVSKELGLKPTGRINVRGVNTTKAVNTGVYDLIDVLLNEMRLSQVQRAQDLALARFNRIKAHIARDRSRY